MCTDEVAETCRGLIAAADENACSSPVVLHLQDNVTATDIDAFCKDPACLTLLDRYSQIGLQCRGCGLPALATIDQFERWPQFTKICAPSCKRQFKTFARHFYSCYEYDSVEWGTPTSDTCASCKSLNTTIRQTAFANDCGGNVTTMYTFVQLMTSRTKANDSRDTSLLMRTCEKLYAPPPPTATPTLTLGATDSSLIVVAGAVVGLLLTIGLFVRWHRRPSPPMPLLIDPSTQEAAADSPTSDLESPTLAFASLRNSTLALLPADTMAQLMALSVHGHVSWQYSIAKGANGQVFLGLYKGQRVAIKALLPERCDVPTDVYAMVDEILMLSRLHHGHITELIGVSFTVPDHALCFLIEYMDQGDLRDLLVQNTPATYILPRKVAAALSVAQALVYLHNLKIIHRDLKSRNVLVDSLKGAKLCDFGVARLASSHDTMTVGVGTYRWMAPEVLSENQYTVAADVFSFGMVLSEIVTHRIPYADIKSRTGQPLVDTAIISLVVNGAITPTLPPDCAPWLVELILRCIATEPHQRPTARDIVLVLQRYSTTMNV
ncbi:TKL protein kinase [Saprolegnia diclina VS20]|uniref:TKL protein kinase n=1 Tax=Saprolegnia diclina (strain VS20) TaxID=1156394 RepID=T0SEI5_SAPDV|nr:TKL protein kinase [Saprolegnia diclina VS20]EQC41337.1 TKL protein kinase [Saprolegnia diclina VS20]|eukprot:XP_008605051.1 TKL protein kinase [Saprolegnia diclina VS20]